MKQDDYEFLVASDLSTTRDGIGIELWEKGKLILEIFRDDSKKTKTVSHYKNSISLELIEQSILFFKNNIPEEFIE